MSALDPRIAGSGPASPSPLNSADFSHSKKLSDVACSDVEWLWPNRVALGNLTLLAGDPGIGKSYLTLDMAARVSTGRGWPDAEAAQPRGSVIVMSAEDDFGYTVCQRLTALEGDLDKVLGYSNCINEQAFDLLDEFERLWALVVRIKDCRLIVVDPISAYLGQLDVNKDSSVRKLLTPLAQLAQAWNLAIVLVTHLRKDNGKAIHRAIGSVAFTAASRNAWVLGYDSSNHQRRLLLPLKENLSGRTTGLTFTIESVVGVDAAILRWDAEPVTVGADDALEASDYRPPPRNHRLRDVMAWLDSHLANGPTPVASIREAAKARGISYGTLRRAFCALGVQTTKVAQNGKLVQMWQLGQVVSRR